jgi:hypothetical protein
MGSSGDLNKMIFSIPYEVDKIIMGAVMLA